MHLIDRFFKLREHDTRLRTEVIAGLTTFATMAYIVAVIPGMLSKAGVPFDAALTVTLLMSMVTTLAMGLYTNRPFVLGPGLGSTAIFSFTLLGGGIPLSVAAGIVFISGVVFMLVSFLGVRDFIVRVIPQSVKVAVGVGIGLFIALLGFKQAGLVVANADKNVLNLGNLNSPVALVTLAGTLLMFALTARRVPGGLILGMAIITLLGLPLGLTDWPGHLFSWPAGVGGMAFELDVMEALKPVYLPFLLAFFIPDFFSTLGTLLGVGGRAGYLDAQGNLPGIDKNFHVDSSTTVLGSVFSCPVLTTYLESAAGVEAGGRTGLTAVIAAVGFGLALFVAPLAAMIPTAATAPVLIVIGLGMMTAMKDVNYTDVTQYLPAFVCVAITLFSFNAGNGIAASLILYAFLKIVMGRWREDHWAIYPIALLMLYYFHVAGH